jgi:hypothetical protein
VLNTHFTTRRIGWFTFVDTRKVLRLRNIVERTGAQLVLSSTWRIADTPISKICLDKLKEEFERVRCPVWVDTTPYLPGAKRQKEIYSWLTLHPEVDNFVILDDMWQELTWYDDRLVATDPAKGLNKERAELAIQLLGEKENE